MFVKENPDGKKSADFTKWSNTLKQFVDKLPTNCLSVFEHFVWLALNGLRFVGCITPFHATGICQSVSPEPFSCCHGV